jgi:hypothetical protein
MVCDAELTVFVAIPANSDPMSPFSSDSSIQMDPSSVKVPVSFVLADTTWGIFSSEVLVSMALSGTSQSLFSVEVLMSLITRSGGTPVGSNVAYRTVARQQIGKYASTTIKLLLESVFYSVRAKWL